MCHTVYSQIFSISGDAFRYQLRICYQLTLTKAERLTPVEGRVGNFFENDHFFKFGTLGGAK